MQTQSTCNHMKFWGKKKKLSWKNGFEKSDKRTVRLIVEKFQDTLLCCYNMWKELGKWRRVNKNGCNEHQPSKSQEAAPCAETIEKPFF